MVFFSLSYTEKYLLKIKKYPRLEENVCKFVIY